MRRIILLALSLFGLFALSLAVFRPSWASTTGLDIWNLPTLARETARQERITKELQRQTEVVKNRTVAKQEVIHDLMEKRVTLLKAAAEFRHLTTEPSEFPGTGPDCFPGAPRANATAARFCSGCELSPRRFRPTIPRMPSTSWKMSWRRTSTATTARSCCRRTENPDWSGPRSDAERQHSGAVGASVFNRRTLPTWRFSGR